MKKSELVALIRETLYADLPEIISEIKASIREELISEMNTPGPIAPAQDPTSIREHVRSLHRATNPAIPRAPEGKQLVVDYKGEKVVSGKGVLDWFEGKVTEGSTAPHKTYTEDQMTNYMTQQFGKNIK